MDFDYSSLIAEIVDLTDDASIVKVLVGNIHFVPSKARRHGVDPNLVRMHLANGSEVIVHGSQIVAVTIEVRQPAVVA